MSNHLIARLRRAAYLVLKERAPVSLARLAVLHGGSAQGSLILVLAAPCVLPVPGVGNVLGSALMWLALAMLRGQDGARMSSRVAEFSIPARWASRMLRLLAWTYARAEDRCQPRWPALTGQRGRAGIAVQVGAMGGLIFLPLPLGNILPAVALVLLGLGLTLLDGLVVALGTLVSLLAMLYSIGVSFAGWRWVVQPLRQWAGL